MKWASSKKSVTYSGPNDESDAEEDESHEAPLGVDRVEASVLVHQVEVQVADGDQGRQQTPRTCKRVNR